jgi:transcriptional regulator with XRE-family HTH domain
MTLDSLVLSDDSMLSDKRLDYAIQVGNELRKHLTEQKMTIQQLSEKSGVPVHYLERLKDCQMTPTDLVRQKLGKAFGVDPEVFDFKEETERNLNSFFKKHADKNANGTLTVKETLIGFFYILREGEYSGKVIANFGDKIDDKDIVRFVKNGVFVWTEQIANIKCEMVFPTFSRPQHKIY